MWCSPRRTAGRGRGYSSRRLTSVADDFELLKAWGAGDREAARELLDHYAHPLYNFFHGKVDGGVEDLVQDTLLACIASRERIRGESSFRSYLFGTARNILLKHLRDRYRGGGELDPERSNLHDVGPSPSAYAAKKAEHRILLEGLRRLPIEQQILLELYYFEGMTALELAAVYELSENALRARVRRSKATLREQMDQLAGAEDLARSSWADFEAWAAGLPEPE